MILDNSACAWAFVNFVSAQFARATQTAGWSPIPLPSSHSAKCVPRPFTVFQTFRICPSYASRPQNARNELSASSEV